MDSLRSSFRDRGGADVADEPRRDRGSSCDLGGRARAGGVVREAFEQYRGRLVPESGALDETPGAIEAELQGRGEALLALDGSAVVGGVMIANSGDDLHLGRLAVRPAARGRGVAQRLVAAVEALAVDRGVAGVQLGVRIALVDNQRFFAQQGYREVSRGTHPGFTQPTWINLRKPTPDTI